MSFQVRNTITLQRAADTFMGSLNLERFKPISILLARSIALRILLRCTSLAKDLVLARCSHGTQTAQHLGRIWDRLYYRSS